jgi:hypothetical protein
MVPLIPMIHEVVCDDELELTNMALKQVGFTMLRAERETTIQLFLMVG